MSKKPLVPSGKEVGHAISETFERVKKGEMSVEEGSQRAKDILDSKRSRQKPKKE